MLTQRDSDLDATGHQIGNHLPKPLIAFVFRVMSHSRPPCLPLIAHPQTVRVWLREGKLRGRLIGGRKSGYRIPASEIDRLLTPDYDLGVRRSSAGPT